MTNQRTVLPTYPSSSSAQPDSQGRYALQLHRQPQAGGQAFTPPPVELHRGQFDRPGQVQSPTTTNPASAADKILGRVGGGVNVNVGDFGFGVSGEDLRGYLAPDSSDRALIERARASEQAAWGQLNKDLDRTRAEFGQRAEYEGQRAQDDTYAALIGQERQAYGDAIAQNTYAAARSGQLGGSATRNREGRLYESSLQRRMEAATRAQAAGLAQRQSILGAGQQIENMLYQSAMMQPNLDRTILDAYQGSRYQGQSGLSMQIEDMMAMLGWQSAMSGAGVRNPGAVLGGSNNG